MAASLAIVLIPTLFFPLGDDPSPDDLNAKVLDFAKSHLGEKIGEGSCSDLVIEAYRKVGAKGPRRDEKGKTVWGEPVSSVKKVKPGDVIQFEDVTFGGQRASTGANGGPQIKLYQMKFGHHSAIVSGVGPGGKTITILNQNITGPDGKLDRTVHELTLTMSHRKKGGSMTIFRPASP